MAGDEKHARELIDRLRKAYRSLDGVVVVSPRLLAEAADALEAERNHMQSLAKWVDVPVSTSSLEIACEVSTALEAALPGDDDWEYLATDSEPGPHHLTRFSTSREQAERHVAARARMGHPSHAVWARRKAGAWGRLEPVEEVPRGSD